MPTLNMEGKPAINQTLEVQNGKIDVRMIFTRPKKADSQQPIKEDK